MARPKETQDALEAIGRRIKARRTELSLTQEAAATVARMDSKRWQHLEAGRVNPTVKTLLVVARALETDLSRFFVD